MDHHQISSNLPSMGQHPPPIMINLTECTETDPEYNKVNIDYMRSDKPFVVIHFILECGKKLEANSLTICTAASLFHKFFSVASLTHYDPYLIAGTCLYLAGKTEDNHLKLRHKCILDKILEQIIVNQNIYVRARNQRPTVIGCMLTLMLLKHFHNG